MQGNTRYRILQRRAGDGWATAGVAYLREGRVTYFSPSARAQRELPVESLDELGPEHVPQHIADGRWLPVGVYQGSVTHPIALLQAALAPGLGDARRRLEFLLRHRGLEEAERDAAEVLARVGPEFRGAALLGEAARLRVLEQAWSMAPGRRKPS